ncbi:MAG: cation:proton antiporter, partial [Planctomycetia bacterium]
MDHPTAQLILELILVLGAGLISGTICKRVGISVLVGYLIVGIVIGNAGLNLIADQNDDLRHLAEAGVLLLLFSIGLELSLDELKRMGRYFFVGGSVQMLAVGVPVFLAAKWYGLATGTSFLIASAVSFSSTVVVFKALGEWGQTASPHGRRAIGILLFQDVTLVPLILLIPLLTGIGEKTSLVDYGILATKSVLFVASVIAIRYILNRWLIPLFGALRSVELVVLFMLTILGLGALSAHLIQLPPMLGALAAGIVLGGNRLSGQIDALILPFRETFAAIFFISLGTFINFEGFTHEQPVKLILLIFGALVLVLVIKAIAAVISLRLTGLSWGVAFGMGLGLAQMGEFSFVLLLEGSNNEQLISPTTYNVMILVGLSTLILTPLLLKRGLDLADRHLISDDTPALVHDPRRRVRHAVVVGIGPIGSQAASQLEMAGIDVCLIDFSPLNLHPFAQQGFHTTAGDACDPDVLDRADTQHAQLVVVTVPADNMAIDIVTSVREINSDCKILVRCRYLTNMLGIKKAGADTVISEEVEA